MVVNHVKRIIYGIVGLIGTCGQVQAQEPVAQRLTLPQAMELTQQNYPSIKAKQAQQEAANYQAEAVRNQRLPEVQFQDQHTFASFNNLAGAYFPNEGSVIPVSGAARPASWQGVWGSFTSLLVNWRVFNFGRLQANETVARRGQQASQADTENEIFQQQVRVADAYLNWLVLHRVVAVQQANLARTQQFEQAVTTRAAAGLRPGVDSSVARAESAKARLLLLESRQNEQTQLLQLHEMMGVRSGVYQPDTSFYSRQPQLALESANAGEAPSLRFLQAQAEQSVAQAEAIRKSYWPSISVLGSFGGRGSGIDNLTGEVSGNFGQGIPYRIGNYLVGVSTRWNLSALPRIRNETRAEQLRGDVFRQQYRQEQLRLSRQSETADLRTAYARQQLLEAPVQTTAARNAYTQATTRYQTGLGTLVEVAQSFVLVNRAEVDEAVANNNLWRSLLLKAAARGDLSVFLNQLTH
ncbi:TolC family protein [Spirosoma sp. RP8]|uniref:TolC family protein n=1 Tax=Spirosoma liriopis TaxID=2937440 RepID=A0ABT0HTJ9_9BACT|nr:TolC family protein [Spirosoma liriopis]MCK8495474.1 TolC family protein [Spirosoma liriopis]